MSESSFELPETLEFRPRWWWDPVPIWLVRELDRSLLVELAAVQLQAQQQMLTVQAKAVEQTLGLLKRQK